VGTGWRECCGSSQELDGSLHYSWDLFLTTERRPGIIKELYHAPDGMQDCKREAASWTTIKIAMSQKIGTKVCIMSLYKF
jgi:hypothetical protein